jgi:hypothetical protein
MAHTEAGQTWLLVTSRTQVSGVAPPPPMAAEFRLHLALALADRASQRDAFVADLAEQLQRHQQAKPRPPAPVAADGAPRSARWGPRRRLLTTAAAASAAVLSLFTIGIALAGNDQHPESLSGSAESPVVPSPAPAATPESPTPGTEATAASRGEPLRQAVPQQRQPLPPPPPPASPSSPSPSPSPPADTLDPWFHNCDEANENGYGPYIRGQDPEYYWYRDRNGDGVVCQP